MPTPKKETPKPEADKAETEPELDRLESLRSEIVEILEEYLDALNEAADKSPGEHNVQPIRTAQEALNLFKPNVPNVYT